jgi:hypothetical protein
MFIFIWQPHSHYSSASHNFISERPITKDGKPVDGLTRWMEDFSRSVIPIMCHSHNDYWRPYPLYSALAAGCTGIEADVWLSDDGTELLVGHDPSELRPEKTLKSMYLDPLLEILNRENPDEQWGNHTVYDRARGIFGTQPNTTVTVLIDVKTDPQKTFELVHAQLEPLRAKQFLYRKQIIHTSPGFREHQDTWPGPLIIVATGNMDRQAYFEYANSRWTPPKNIGPWEEVFPTHWEHHDYFYDAPLGELPSTNKFFEAPDGRGGRTTWANIIHSEGEAYYASVSFNKAIGSVKFGFSTSQLATLREQIRVANKSGLQARYWDLPSWPINYRDYVWDVLTREGVGMLSVDDLESAARRGWSKGYMRNVVWMICVSLWIFGSSVVGLLVVYRMLRKRTEMLLGLEQRRGIYLE